jgi:hypothetical protein
MFLFGHLGFGSLIGKLGARLRPQPALLIGTLLPDLIDKPIYLASAGLVQSTRSLAHTGVFFALLILATLVSKNQTMRLLTFGVFTHLFIDFTYDAFVRTDSWARNEKIIFWPIKGLQFPPTPYLTLNDQIQRFRSPTVYLSEFLGLIVLLILLRNEQNRKSPQQSRAAEHFKSKESNV